MVKGSGYTKDDLKAALDCLIWSTEKENKKVAADNELPIILKIVAKTLLNAYKKKQFSQVIDILKIIGIEDREKIAEELIINIKGSEKLLEKSKEEVRDLVPPHVFKTQSHYMECPSCNRIYWQGTHWQAMTEDLEKLIEERQKRSKRV